MADDGVFEALAPVPPLTAEQVARHKRTAVARRSGELLTVYRVQLVEERKIVVPRRRIDYPRHAAELARQYLDGADRETFIVIMLDAAHHVLGVHTAAVGCIDRVAVSPRSVYKAALLRNAEKVIVAHNHVWDDVQPSREDRRLTRVLRRAGDSLHIELKDHLIIGRGKQRFSFAEEGLL